MRKRPTSLGALVLLSLAAGATAQAQSSGALEVIETGEVGRLDAWTVAALGRSDGALPSSLWRQTDAAALAIMFDALPARFESPAALHLARRALASSGAAPGGEAAADAARKRFSALGRIGFADDISVMSAGAGAALTDPMIAQFAAQAELARGRVTESCRRAANVEGEQPAFLLRLRAYCAASAGETAAADLALEIARGAGADDAWFRSVINAMSSRPARPPAGRYDTSLNASASLTANLTPGANPLSSASSLALVAVARGENAAPALRAQAAAFAFRRGLLAPREARTAILTALQAQSENMPPLAIALRQADQAPGSLETAAAIAGLLRPNTAYVDFAAAARLFKDDIAALEHAPNAAAAAAFARAALAAGDARLAARLLESAALADVSAATLSPLEAARAILAHESGDPALVVQRRRENAAASAAGRRALSRDLMVLSALGYPLDEAAAAHVTAHPPQGGRGDAAAIAALTASAETGAIGATALLAAALGAPGLHTLDAASLAALIRALRAVGLEDAARAFAVEALIGGAP